MNKKRKEDICISGLGLISKHGDTLRDYMEGIYKISGKSVMLTDYDILRNIEIPVMKAEFFIDCENPETRILSMGRKAICDAVRDRNSNHFPDIERVCLILGSGMGLADQYYYDDSKYSIPNYYCSLAERLSEITGLNCDAVYIGNACAAGSQAVSYGMDLLKSKRCDLVIAGGIDILSQSAYAGFLRLNAIDRNGCKPFDKGRKGIAIGEGAVFYTMERRADIEPGRTIYCTLPGAGITCDAYHIVQMDPNGKEIYRAIEQALSYSCLRRCDVDMIVAHGTGTALNDKIESQIIRNFFRECTEKIYVTTPKGSIGHTGGASGTFGILTAICVMMTGIIPPICNLEEPDPECEVLLVYGNCRKSEVKIAMVNAFAFGGTNVVLICKKEELDVMGCGL